MLKLLQSRNVFASAVAILLVLARRFTFTWCLPLCPVLHRPSEGPFIDRSLGQRDGRGGGPPQCAGGQVQQCDDALRDAAAVDIHLPQLPAALSVSTCRKATQHLPTTRHLFFFLCFRHQRTKNLHPTPLNFGQNTVFPIIKLGSYCYVSMVPQSTACSNLAPGTPDFGWSHQANKTTIVFQPQHSFPFWLHILMVNISVHCVQQTFWLPSWSYCAGIVTTYTTEAGSLPSFRVSRVSLLQEDCWTKQQKQWEVKLCNWSFLASRNRQHWLLRVNGYLLSIWNGIQKSFSQTGYNTFFI